MFSFRCNIYRINQGWKQLIILSRIFSGLLLPLVEWGWSLNSCLQVPPVIFIETVILPSVRVNMLVK